MKNLTIAILLRVSLLVIICFYLFEISNFSTSNYSKGINPYIIIAFPILLLLMSRQQHVYKKSRPNDTIRYREKILPEFNIKDEREAVITGYAAKNALSFILIFTPIAMTLVAFLFINENPYSMLLIFLTIAAVPIIGLIVYYITSAMII